MKLPMRWFAGVLALGVGLSGFVGVSQAFAQSTTRNVTSASYADDPAPTFSANAMRSRAVPRPRRSGTPAGFAGFRHTSTGGYVPRHERGTGSVIVQQGSVQSEEMIGPPTETIVDVDVKFDGPMMDGGCDDCGGSGNLCGNSCGQCCLIPCPTLENMTVFAGTQGFKNGLNLDGGGSFGFHQGLNWGGRLPLLSSAGFGWQAGGAAVQSSLSGAAYTDNSRKQYFGTLGLFRRVDCGLQMGVVYDFMRDDWYTKTDMVQIRGEISWVTPHRNEFGFWFASSDRQTVSQGTLSSSSLNFVTKAVSATSQDVTVTLETTDIFAAFYRRQIQCGGEWRVFAGGTNNDGGILGGNLSLPLTDCWGVESGFTYLIPQESAANGGYLEESWNIGLSFVWHPRGGARSGQGNYYRPLLNVANNGSFLTRASVQ